MRSVFACLFIAVNRNKIIQSHESTTRDPKADIFANTDVHVYDHVRGVFDVNT